MRHTRRRQVARGEVVTWLDVLKLIGRIVWTVLRICLTIFLAIVLGGFRGASQAKMSSASPK
jgi:hypothetical protein